MLFSLGSSTFESPDELLPRVSVVVPYYNQTRYAPEALKSIFSQGYSNLEVILVDDGSTEGDLAWASGFGDSVKILSQENSGPASARNRALKAAEGDIVAFLDSDDVWPAEKLQSQLLPLLADENVSIVLSKLRTLKMGEGASGEGQLSEDAFYTIQLGCLLVRREVFDRVGLFDETLIYSEDQDWFLRVREEGIPIVKVECDGLLYRKHPDSLCKQEGRGRDFGLLQVLRRSLKRRKAVGSAQSLLSISNIPSWQPVNDA